MYTDWNLWKERNRRIFEAREADPVTVFKLIKGGDEAACLSMWPAGGSRFLDVSSCEVKSLSLLFM
jgi:hypothetical protein